MMDATTDYQSALAAAQALYDSQQATEDATWQSAFQGAQDTLTGQLSGISSDEDTFVQGEQQDISNTIAAQTTIEQNSEAAADQQAEIRRPSSGHPRSTADLPGTNRRRESGRDRPNPI